MADLTQDQWVAQLAADDNAVILDVRTADEVSEGFIPNAIHIDFHLGQGFVDGVNALDKTKNYYVYCRSGGRSAQACAVMTQMCHFETAHNLLGGFMNWQGEVSQN
jgi:rhodanese-related sulfurtransferase